MFPGLRQRFDAALDLIVEFSTLGEYRLAAPAAGVRASAPLSALRARARGWEAPAETPRAPREQQVAGGGRDPRGVRRRPGAVAWRGRHPRGAAPGGHRQPGAAWPPPARSGGWPSARTRAGLAPRSTGAPAAGARCRGGAPAPPEQLCLRSSRSGPDPDPAPPRIICSRSHSIGSGRLPSVEPSSSTKRTNSGRSGIRASIASTLARVDAAPCGAAGATGVRAVVQLDRRRAAARRSCSPRRSGGRASRGGSRRVLGRSGLTACLKRVVHQGEEAQVLRCASPVSPQSSIVASRSATWAPTEPSGWPPAGLPHASPSSSRGSAATARSRSFSGSNPRNQLRGARRRGSHRAAR